MFCSLLDFISTHTTLHRPRESFHLEPVPLLLEVMHGILESEILNSNDSKTNTCVCLDIYPRSVHRHSGQLNLFSGYINKTWSHGKLVHLHMFWSSHSAEGSHGWEQSVDCRQAGSLHNIIFYSGTIRSPIFPNSILTLQDFMKIYLSRQKDRIYFISQSVNWILTFKYLDIWYVGHHLYPTFLLVLRLGLPLGCYLSI